MPVNTRSKLQQIVTHIQLIAEWRSGALCTALVIAIAVGGVLSQSCVAANLDVQVSDRSGKPVKDVVVTISDGRSSNTGDSRSWIMDQLNMRFEPQVLVVPVHALVKFPNSDAVSHQVYSFSKPKSFQLPLYKGQIHAPVSFDTPGLVVLGCNIHDEMIGYIYVTSARWFGKTDAGGELNFSDINAVNVNVTIWSPYIADKEATLTREVAVDSGTVVVKFNLEKALRNAPEPRPRNPDWDY
jgi:plastocyanin